ncbi:uncharacterized protein LOC124535898 [Vanessa cardui]|uniref:uncharacterized protein LOC124535898 n=1 Tax=Vanessa cardui TaxID=171605 RepID=UPI001F13E72C|nr:uncharacterized protein LOC124535898 [Vanessa cardui]
MTMENYLSQLGMAQKQFIDRYAEYSGPGQDQSLYYPYEPAPSQVHVNPPFKQTRNFEINNLIKFSSQFISGGHKNNAAMSALTLLAFLFFLHILQQCLKDHMTAMSTSQVMIMTGGREGDEHIAKISHSKIDKTGELETEQENKDTFNHGAAEASNDNKEKHLMKIPTTEHGSWKQHDTREKYQENRKVFNRFGNQHSTSSGYISAAENETPDFRIH